MFKDDLTIHEFSLKKIIENFDKIPEKTGKFGEPSNTLSKEEKKKLWELMRKFNEYGQSLRGDQALMETAKTLSEISAMAKKYAMSENNIDVLQKETVQRDFKQVDGITQNFQKLAKECVSKVMQLNALYEDLGHIYERYYEMENINEVSPPSNPQTNLPISECPGAGDDHDLATNEEGI
jgi:DNA repair ATPase RecN